jgi:hypothetical protein
VSPSRLAFYLAIVVSIVPLGVAAGASLDSRIGSTAPYLPTNREAEIALARTAAPPSISANASVYILGPHGYEKVVDGTNGWACIVGHSFDAFFNDSEFWLPENRSPACLNPPAVATELPRFVQRSQWVMAGASIREMIAKTKAALADGSIKQPAPDAFAFMLSKKGYLNHAHGPWHPHVMFFVPYNQLNSWGATSVSRAPIQSYGDNGSLEPLNVDIPVKRWSDGSLDKP